jgi:hypothetical protein
VGFFSLFTFRRRMANTVRLTLSTFRLQIESLRYLFE